MKPAQVGIHVSKIRKTIVVRRKETKIYIKKKEILRKEIKESMKKKIKLHYSTC